jgi:hypothetical protein
MDMFQTPPAGTPVEPTNGVRYYYRQQIYPATPSTGPNFTPGREVQFRFQASSHAFVPQESRLMARVRVDKSNDNGATWTQAVEPSLRYAADPLSRLFDQARLSVNGTTVDNVSTDVQDISTIQLRLEGTKAGAAAAGSAGLLSFDQRMHHAELAGTGTGNGTYAYNAAGVLQAAGAVGIVGTTAAIHEAEIRNEKQRMLLDAAAAGVVAGGFGNANGDQARLHEISTPLGQQFTFFRQNKAFLRNMEFDIRMVVSSEGAHDALYTQTIPAQPRNQGLEFLAPANAAHGVGQVGSAVAGAVGNSAVLGWEAQADVDRTFVQLQQAVPPAAASVNGANNIRYRVYVEDLFIDAMMAVPRVSIPPPMSMQIPYQSITQYTRALTQTTSFQETFSGIPPSVTGMIVAMRTEAHGFTQNRELYLAGGSGSDCSFKNFQLQMGTLSLPSPAYDLDLPQRRAGRAFADYVSFVGGDHRDGTGAMSYTEWCESPLLCFRILQNPGEFSSTVSLKFTTQGQVPAGTTLMLFCLHSKVFEAEWSDPGGMPTKVLTDEILGA